MEFFALFHGVTLRLSKMFRDVSRRIMYTAGGVEHLMGMPRSPREQFPVNQKVHRATPFFARVMVMTIGETLRHRE